MDKALTVTKVHIIRFGGITQRVFTFKDGLNVIYGTNRSGKTTLCEFIRFMFYEFRGREPEDFYPYDSDNRSVCGSMTVKYGQRTYEIFREKNAAGNVLAITDTERSQPLILPDGMSPGEYFLGISHWLYDRSLYCPQDMAGLVSDGSLKDCESELIASYSGEPGFLHVSASLEKRKSLISNPEKSGTLDLAFAEKETLEGELCDAILKQEDMIGMEVLIDEITHNLTDVEKQIVLAKADIESYHEMQVEESLRKIENARKETERAKAEYERLLNSEVTAGEVASAESIKARYEALQAKKTELEELETRIADSKANLDTHNEMVASELYCDEDFENVLSRVEKREKSYRLLTVLSLTLFSVCAIAFAAVFLFRESVSFENIIYIICGAGAVSSAVMLIVALILSLTKNSLYRAVDTDNRDEFEEAYEICRSRTQSRAIYVSAYEQDLRIYDEKTAEYKKELAAISHELELDESFPDHERLSRAVTEKCVAEAKIEAAKKRYEQALCDYEGLGSAEFILKTEQNAQKLVLREKELKSLNARRDDLFDKKRSLEATFSTSIIHTERPAYIKTRLNVLSEKIAESFRDLTAISMALRITGDTLKVMRFRIQQHLADGVRRNLKFILRDSEAFVLDDSYSLQYKNGTRIFPVFTDGIGRISRAAKGVSRSLAESAAIILRISLTELLETECATAVFDEPFAFLDEDTEKKLMEKLMASKSVQTFICTSRKFSEDEEGINVVNIDL